MTPRERTLTVLAKERPDRLPREVKLTPLLETFRQRTGFSDSAEYSALDVRHVFFAPPMQMVDFTSCYPDRMPRLLNPAGWQAASCPRPSSSPGAALGLHPHIALSSDQAT